MIIHWSSTEPYYGLDLDWVNSWQRCLPNLDISVTDVGGDSEAVALLIDVLLREMIGVLEGITIDETPEAVSESGIGTDTVIVDKAQVYRMVSDVRPLYNIISIIRERYKVSSIIRELYKMKTHVREG